MGEIIDSYWLNEYVQMSSGEAAAIIILTLSNLLRTKNVITWQAFMGAHVAGAPRASAKTN